jgi:hypothetical protein
LTEKAAESIVTYFEQENFRAIGKFLDKSSRERFTPELWREYWQEHRANQGAFKGILRTTAAVEDGLEIAYVMAEYERAIMSLRFVFDRNLQVSSIGISDYAKQEPEPPSPRPIMLANQFVDHVVSEEFGKAIKLLSRERRPEGLASETRARWDAFIEKAGPFVKRTDTTLERLPGYHICYVTLEFEKAQGTLKIFIDRKTEEIDDFYFWDFVPHPEASEKPEQ